MGLDIWFNKVKDKELLYYRKVNFLVDFFDRKLGTEVLNLSGVEVYRDDIELLKEYCGEVIKDHSKAKELLPTTTGFFFGSDEYNEYYFEDIKQVYEDCDKLLEEFDNLKDDEHIEFKIWY